MVTSLLTLYTVVKAWSYAFWRPRPTPETEHTAELPALTPSFGRLSDAIGATLATDRPASPITPPEQRAPTRTTPPLMLAGASGVVLVSLGLSLLAGPLFAYTDAAAEQMVTRDAYVESVLPEETS